MIRRFTEPLEEDTGKLSGTRVFALTCMLCAILVIGVAFIIGKDAHSFAVQVQAGFLASAVTALLGVSYRTAKKGLQHDQPCDTGAGNPQQQQQPAEPSAK